jgi:hypothetical protein
VSNVSKKISWKDLEKMALDIKGLERYGCGPMPQWGLQGEEEEWIHIVLRIGLGGNIWVGFFLFVQWRSFD